MNVVARDGKVVIELEQKEAAELSESLVSTVATSYFADETVKDLSYELIQALYSKPKTFNFITGDWDE